MAGDFPSQLVGSDRVVTDLYLQYIINLGMKWSKFIQDDTSAYREDPSQSRLNKSRITNGDNTKQFRLRSIEKVRNDSSNSKLNKINSFSSISENQGKFQLQLNKHISNIGYTELIRKFQSSPNFISESRFKANDIDQLSKILQNFNKELQELLRRYVQRIDKVKGNTQMKQTTVKRILASTQQIINKFTSQPSKLDNQSPIRKSFSCIENKTGNVVKEVTSEKKKARVLQFKNEKVEEKNNFVKIQSAFGKMSALLADQARRPKFVRKPREGRLDANDSSVESVIQKSMNESRKSRRSRLKSKDALYNISKILYE